MKTRMLSTTLVFLLGIARLAFAQTYGDGAGDYKVPDGGASEPIVANGSSSIIVQQGGSVETPPNADAITLQSSGYTLDVEGTVTGERHGIFAATPFITAINVNGGVITGTNGQAILLQGGTNSIGLLNATLNSNLELTDDSTDMLTITGSQVNGHVLLNGGTDSLIMDSSTITGQISMTTGNDIIQITNSTLSFPEPTTIMGTAGNKSIFLNGVSGTKELYLPGGSQTVSLQNANVSGKIFATGGNHNIRVNSGSLGGEVYLTDGGHAVAIVDGSVGGKVYATGGSQTVNVTAGGVGGELYLTGGDHTVTLNDSWIGGKVYAADGSHNIDVLRGAIDNELYLTGGDHTVTLDDSWLGGKLYAADGSHNIRIVKGGVGGELYLTGGGHAVTIEDAWVGGQVYAADGNQNVNILRSSIDSELNLTGGDHTVTLDGSWLGGKVYATDGSHNIKVIESGVGNEVFLTGGSHTVSLLDTWVGGKVYAVDGNQNIDIFRSSIDSELYLTGGDHTVTLDDSWLGGKVYATDGSHNINIIKGGVGNEVFLMGGSHTVSLLDASLGGKLYAAGGTQAVSLTNTFVAGEVFLHGGGTVVFQNSTIADQFYAGGGAYNVSVTGGSIGADFLVDGGIHTVMVANTSILGQVLLTGGGKYTYDNDVIGGGMVLQGNSSYEINLVGGTSVGGPIVTDGNASHQILMENASSGDRMIINGLHDDSAIVHQVSLSHSTVGGELVVIGGGHHQISLFDTFIDGRLFVSTGNASTVQLTDGTFIDGIVDLDHDGAHQLSIHSAHVEGGIGTSDGDDTVAIELSTVNDTVHLAGGNNNLTVDNSTITTTDVAITAHSGNDQIRLENESQVEGNIFTNDGADSITVDNSRVIGKIGLGAGDDTVIVRNGSTVTESIHASSGNNQVTISGGSLVALEITGELGNDMVTVMGNLSRVNGDIHTNAGNNTITVSDNALAVGDVTAGEGDDQVNVNSGATVMGNIYVNRGNNQVVIDGGNVQGIIASEDGDDTVRVQNGGTVADINLGAGTNPLYMANDSAITGTVNNVSSLEMQIGGTGTLSGSVDVSGPVTVTGGTLVVNGMLTATGSTVEEQGGLGGTGSVEGNVVSHGSIRPGNSIGTLSVVGDMTSSGTFDIEAMPGGAAPIPGTDNDLLDVSSGMATINGGGVDVNGTPGDYLTGSTYTFLTATDGVTVNTAPLYTDNIDMRRIIQVAGANTLGFKILRDVPFATIGQTPNEISFGTYFDTVKTNPDLQQIRNELDLLPDESDVQPAMNQLVGDVYGSLPIVGVQNTSHMLRLLSQQMGSGSGACFDGWVLGYGLSGEVDSDGNAVGLDNSVDGVAFGVSRLLNDCGCKRVGLFGGYGNMSIDTTAPTQSANADNAMLGGFLHSRDGCHYYLLAGAAGYDDLKTSRQINFGGINRIARGDFEGNQAAAYLERGWDLCWGRTRLRPLGSLQYIYLHQEGFTETGAGAASLTVASLNVHSLRSSVGGHLDWDYCTTRGNIVSPHVRVAWQHEYLDTNAVVTSGFGIATPPTFAASGLDLGRDWALLGVGITISPRDNLSLTFAYDAQLNERQTFHVGSGRLALLW